MQKILIIEDDQDISENIACYLRSVEPGLTTAICHDGLTGFSLAASDPTVALLVLDLGLPDLDGLNVCQRLRGIGWTKPIIMLTARDTIEDRVRGLENGADDYLIKPFALMELHARIRAQLRRCQQHSPQQILRIADLTLDLQTMTATRAGKSIRLNATTLKILSLLMKKSPAVVTKEELESTVWPNASPSNDTVRSHMYLLRNSIDKPFDTALLHTLPGIGWSLRTTTPQENPAPL